MATPTMFVPTVERLSLPRSRGGRPPRLRLNDPSPPTSLDGSSAPLSTLGKKGSATIAKRRRNWAWLWLGGDVTVPLAPFGLPRLLYPATNEDDSSRAPDLPLSTMLASATQYIQSIPDIYEPEVVAQLACDELATTHRESSRHQLPDRRRGRRLAVIHNPTARLARVALCFPTGKVGEELNISPFLPKTNALSQGRLESRFVPNPVPIDRFPREILQIVTSPFVSTHRSDGAATALVVRTANCSYLLNVVPHGLYLPPSTATTPVSTVRTGELTVAATDGHQHVDVALDPSSWSRAAVVDDSGGVWLWWEEKERHDGRLQKVAKLAKIRSSVSSNNGHNGFFRVAFGTRRNTLIVLSRDTIEVLDLTDASDTSPVASLREPAVLFKLNSASQIFTSIDKTALERNAAYTCVSTTKEVIWIDENAVEPVALRCVHEYGAGTANDLEVLVLAGLSPTQDSIYDTVTIYSPTSKLHQAVQVSNLLPTRLVTAPWSVSSVPRIMESMVVLPFHKNREDPDGCVYVVGNAADGSISLIKLAKPTPPIELDSSLLPQIKWDNQVQALVSSASRAAQTRLLDTSEYGPRARTKHVTFHARWVWSAINEGPQQSADFATFQQHLLEQGDVPVAHVITASEFARDSASSEGPRTRSNLLRRVAIPNDLAARVGPDTFSPTFPLVSTCGDTFGAEDENNPTMASALNNGSTSTPSNRAERETAQLTCDLGLSRILLAPQSIPDTPPAPVELPSADDLFVAAAGQLSLDDTKATRVAFALLQPRLLSRDIAKSDPIGCASAAPLLGEWRAGDNVRDYQWNGPLPSQLANATMIPRAPRPIRPLPSPRFVQHAQYAPPRSGIPPAAGAWQSLRHQTTSVPALPTTQIPTVARSSPPPAFGSQSLAADIPHTQVERGPFGARPELSAAKARKKPIKKRAGGF